MSDDITRDQWLKTATRLRWRFNFSWWYQMATLPLIFLAFAGGGYAVLARRNEWGTGPWFWSVMAVLGVAVVLFAWRRARRHFISQEDALVRMEADLGLNNALSAAQSGHRSWPPFMPGQAVVRWRWGQVLLPFVGAISFVLLGAFLPVSPVEKRVIENEPYSWSRLEAEVEELVEDDVIDEDYAEELKKRIDELREQEASDWFSAASLEATDSLQQAHSREMNRLERDLMQVENALRKASEPGATEAQRQKLQQQFEEAMEGMRNGQMKPNEDLMKKLADAAKEGMEGMSEEERQKMQERLRKLAEKLKEMQGEGPGEGEGDGEGEAPGEGPGKGDVDRGPGDGGDLFGADSPGLELEKFERLKGGEDKEPDPGDLLNLEEIEHDKDTSRKGPVASGAAKSEGLGGDRVWRDSLDPDEQKSLKSFFE